MSIIKCPECGNKISSTVDRCQNCGCILTEEMKIRAFSDMQEYRKRKRMTVVILSIILTAILVVSAIVIVVKVNNLQEQKRIEELAKKEYDEFYTNSGLYCSTISEVYSSWLDFTAKRKKVWYNCLYEKNDIETDDYTLDSDYNFYEDFNTALLNWMDSDDYKEKNQKCVSAINNAKILYKKITEYKSEDKKVKEIKDLVSQIQENVLNMDKYESSYGYNYSEYDKKMDDFLSDISDLDTKLELEVGKK